SIGLPPVEIVTGPSPPRSRPARPRRRLSPPALPAGAPPHFTCAAGVNPALRQGFPPAGKALVRRTRAAGPAGGVPSSFHLRGGSESRLAPRLSPCGESSCT